MNFAMRERVEGRNPGKEERGSTRLRHSDSKSKEVMACE
jgi:hypothetical protein